MEAWMITWVDEDFGTRSEYFLNKENAVKRGEEVFLYLCTKEEFKWANTPENLNLWRSIYFIEDVIWLQKIPFSDEPNSDDEDDDDFS